MDDLLTDSFEQLLAGHCDPARLRQIEAGGSAAGLWALLQDSGFADALVPAAQQGAGLGLADCAGLVMACGRHLLPLPLAQTLLVRAELAGQGLDLPEGAISIADAVRLESEGAIVARNVPCGRTADWVLVPAGRVDLLLPADVAARAPAGGHGCLDADLRWNPRPAGAIELARRRDWSACAAALTAGLMAGAMQRVGEMSIDYANTRVQFGKPIGKLQAIQQQLSVLAEQMYAARSAALLGLSSADSRIDATLAAVAKSRCSEAAVAVATIAHAVHGAIGITEEYDLQLYTRRLHDWRRHYGSESCWHARLGATLIDDGGSPLELLLGRLTPAA
jgi:acyl-CoA dehydrogenase